MVTLGNKIKKNLKKKNKIK